MAFNLVDDPNHYEIFEKNLTKVRNLQEDQTKNLLRQFRMAAAMLRSRLGTVDKDTFTESQLKIVEAQVFSSIDVLENNLRGEVLSGYNILNDQAIHDTVLEVGHFEDAFRDQTGEDNSNLSYEIPLGVILNSMEKDNYLFNRYSKNVSGYVEKMKETIQSSLTQSLIQKDSYWLTVEKVIQRINNPAEEWKIHRIARTELHNIYNITKMKSLNVIKDKYIPNMKKKLYHPMDHRTAEDSIQLAKDNPEVDIDKPFVQEFNGHTYTFMAPPNRPNDRAILIPFNPDWKSKNRR